MNYTTCIHSIFICHVTNRFKIEVLLKIPLNERWFLHLSFIHPLFNCKTNNFKNLTGLFILNLTLNVFFIILM